MATDVTPAIRRDMTDEDSNAHVFQTIHEDVQRHRGLGYSGKLVEHVAFECPCCERDRMIRLTHVQPESRDGVTYWCLNPACRYFVSGELSWATRSHPDYEPETPEIWTQTYVCVECDEREHIEITKAEYRTSEVEDGIVQHLCEACEAEALEVA